MSVNAVVSAGTEFKRGDGASNETFTKLTEVQSITLPSRNRATIDVSDLDSSIKEFQVGMRDSGEITLTQFFERDAYLDMNTDFESTSSVNYQIVFPDTGNTTIDFAAFVTALGGSVPGPDEIITVEVTYKITGDVTLSS